MPYLAFVCSTSLNYGLIRAGSSHRARCLLYARLKLVLRLSVRLTKLAGYFCPTWLALRTASSLLAISRIAAYVGANLRVSRLSMYLIITSSSHRVSFLELGWQSRRAGFLARRSRSVDSGTLNVDAVRLTYIIWVALIAEIAS
jgi:hypothetical protein